MTTNGVAINNGDIYVTGSIGSPAGFEGVYWVNNIITHVPQNSNVQTATSFIAFAGHDVYVSGTSSFFQSNSSAGYWKNANTFVKLPGQFDIGRGIAVVTHPHH